MSFKDLELRCRCCGLLKLHRGFRDELNAVRQLFARPMIVNSCCRCQKHNANEGGHVRSLHVGDFPAHADKGQQGAMAVDIAIPDGSYRGTLFSILWTRGWSVGWGKTFLHGDRRDWLGMKQTSFDY